MTRIVLILYLLLWVAGCTEDETKPQGTGTKQELRLSLSTYAIDPNATADEAAIRSVYVYIFNEYDVLENPGSVIVTGTPLTNEAGVLNAAWRVTAGEKTIFVIAYAPTAPFRDKTVTNFQNVQYTFMGANLGWCEGDILRYDARNCEITFTQRATGEKRTIAVRQLPRSVVQGPGNNPYYQFGRKDPILAGVWVNGKAQDKYHYCGRGGSSDHFRDNGKVSIGTAIMNPHIIYSDGGVSPTDWCNETLLYNLWNINNISDIHNDDAIAKTIYDPSPVGYCLPPSNVFTGFTSSGQEEADSGYGTRYNSPYTSTADFVTNKGFVFYCNRMTSEGEYDPEGGIIFFPASGNRKTNTGELANMGSFGFYRSAGVNRLQGSFGMAFNPNLVNPYGNNTRSAGFSVRPVREK